MTNCLIQSIVGNLHPPTKRNANHHRPRPRAGQLEQTGVWPATIWTNCLHLYVNLCGYNSKRLNLQSSTHPPFQFLTFPPLFTIVPDPKA